MDEESARFSGWQMIRRDVFRISSALAAFSTFCTPIFNADALESTGLASLFDEGGTAPTKASDDLPMALAFDPANWHLVMLPGVMRCHPCAGQSAAGIEVRTRQFPGAQSRTYSVASGVR